MGAAPIRELRRARPRGAGGASYQGSGSASGRVRHRPAGEAGAWKSCRKALLARPVPGSRPPVRVLRDLQSRNATRSPDFVRRPNLARPSARHAGRERPGGRPSGQESRREIARRQPLTAEFFAGRLGVGLLHRARARDEHAAITAPITVAASTVMAGGDHRPLRFALRFALCFAPRREISWPAAPTGPAPRRRPERRRRPLQVPRQGEPAKVCIAGGDRGRGWSWSLRGDDWTGWCALSVWASWLGCRGRWLPESRWFRSRSRSWPERPRTCHRKGKQTQPRRGQIARRIGKQITDEGQIGCLPER